MNGNVTDAATTPGAAILPGDTVAPNAPALSTGSLPIPDIPDYELLKRIGRGSYGEVWLARNVMGTCRAVKIVHRQAFETDRPFEREFDGIKKFEPISQSHESQLKVLHVGRRERCFFYVMELADDANGGSRQVGGERNREAISPVSYTPRTLRSEIQRRGRFPVEDCLDISLRLTEALAHLHRHGLVHRDIKPSNIIFVNGLPKLADIGLVADTEGTLSFVGTEGYIPPEGPGKPPADIFSLGKVLYEIGTGQDRDQFPELPTAWDTAAEREAFAELNEVIINACAAQAAQRYKTAGQMHEELLLLRAGKSLRRLRLAERRARDLLRAVAVLVLLGVIGSAGFFYQRRQTTIVAGLVRREASQRQKAESARTQVELVRACELLEREDTRAGLVQLARTLRDSPTNRFAAERLMAAINQSNFLLPLQDALRHQDEIRSACFSPDGRWIATASKDMTARIWSASSGQPLTRPLQHGGEVNSVRFSPDCQRVVTACTDGAARVWEIASGETLGTAFEHGARVGYAEFSPDGRRILTVSGVTARLWDVNSGKLVGDRMRHEEQPADPSLWWEEEQGGAIRAACFSPDGTRVATASNDGTARIWDAATGSELVAPLRHGWRGIGSGAVRSVQFSPDGQRIVTASRDRTARIWDAHSGKALVGPLEHSFPVNDARFSPDGRRVLTVSNDRTARVWDAFSGAPLTEPILFGEAVLEGTFSPNGRWIVTREDSWTDGVARVLDAQSGQARFEPRGHSGTFSHVAISPDGAKVLTVSGQKAWLWDALPSQTQSATLATSGWVGLAQFSPDGSLVVTADPAEVSSGDWHDPDFAKTNSTSEAWIWSARSGQPVAGPLRHEHGIISAEFSPDGQRLVTASRDQTARVWDVRTGQPLTAPLIHPQVVRFARFTPDGRRIITSCWLDRAWLWDASTGKLLRQFHGTGPWENSNPFMPVRSEDISPNGQWLATCSRDGARIWDIATGQLILGPLAVGENVRSARFSPDGTRLVTTSLPQNHACIWDLRNGERIAGPLPHNWRIVMAQFSPDGRKVVSRALDQTARIWDAESGQLLTKPLEHGGEVLHAEFSPDGRRVITASWWDHAALLWDAETGLRLSEPLRHSHWVNYATFSPDGRWVVSAGNDRTARLWEIPLASLPIPDWLPAFAEALVGRRINAQGLPEPVPIEDLVLLKQRIISSTAADDYTHWAKWFFADRSQRTISAFSEITIPEYLEQLLKENTQRSLEEAVRLAPTNGLAYSRLASRALEPDTNHSKE